MPREKELFRDNLVRLDEAFPGKEVIKCVDVARYLGIDARSAKKFYLKGEKFISKVKLASALS